MKDFVISYTSADRQWAEWIARQLKEAGYKVVIQAWHFRPGCNFVEEMERALKEAERTLAVLTPRYFSSQFTLAEWSAAFAKGILLPVRRAGFEDLSQSDAIRATAATMGNGL